MSEKYAVKSRNGGNVFYQIPERGIVRTFANEEVKWIDLDELEALSYVDGGEYMLRNSLIVAEEALNKLGIEVEPEYFYTEKEILEILEKGTLDQLEDTLNFAPQGVISIIQQLGVRIELPDTRKRKLIFEKTGFNIDGALAIKQIVESEPEEEKEEEQKPKRKASPFTVDSKTPQRKATAPKKYNIITDK